MRRCSLKRFGNLTRATCKGPERIPQDHVFSLREDLSDRLMLTFDKFEKCRVVLLHSLIETVHMGSLRFVARDVSEVLRDQSSSAAISSHVQT